MGDIRWGSPYSLHTRVFFRTGDTWRLQFLSAVLIQNNYKKIRKLVSNGSYPSLVVS
jgi:hypothetical protein